jgi:hypothetical protein
VLDTIDMLETIGSDASLRYASVEELTDVVERAQASEGLAAAVASGDARHLAKEFGIKQMFLPQIVQVFSSTDIE